MKAETFTNPVMGIEHGEWTWCFHCERAYPTRHWIENGWICPGPGCSAGPVEAHRWAPDDWPRKLRPEYPAVPVAGERYPRWQSSIAG